MKKLSGVVGLVAAVGGLAGVLGLAASGTAVADTSVCSDTVPAHTNGNPANDVPQQFNKLTGTLLDTGTCTAVQANSGLNGADNDSNGG
ncbi:hypothetical protein [Streptomyces telluris]|uniref:Secreted protein n=1 Tax=Streptomyces telluris TaxID=2720021 RepID=A0A9X2LGR7_9ACTN|nr:hypothetical protein [Streptomyces telluris]MCQ8770853.1 hypothetical protein [Streptomyces telluris]NJP78701.1 hypothetical protein [Streptomyces telluris]